MYGRPRVDAVTSEAAVSDKRMRTRSLTTRLIDPRTDDQWRSFVEYHPQATVFHQPPWIEAVCDSFGYAPRFHVLEDASRRIVAAWPNLLVRSRLTGTRLVCLPFCHRAGPLLETSAECGILWRAVLDSIETGAGRIEVRGWPSQVEVPPELTRGSHFVRHVLDLSPGSDRIYTALDKDVRYSIRRAEREGVRTRVTTSEDDLPAFKRLYLALRRRQGLLPQPDRFLEAIYRNFVVEGDGFIVMAEIEGRPVATMLSVGNRGTIVGTHSGIDPAARSRRTTYASMWASIEEGCRRGYLQYDLGRSHSNDTGLTHFKEQWGAQREPLAYLFHPAAGGFDAGDPGGVKRAAMGLFARNAPLSLLARAGSILYPHLG